MKSQTISTIHRFLLLPSHILIILLLEFLNSFRSYGLRFVLYNYITNEFISNDDGSSNNNNISDTQAGALLGAKSLLDIVFGLSGSILVDYIGVRRVSLVALSVALLSRAILALSRTTILLYVALFVSSFGDALLSIGLYRVALKKLSTPKTRPLCFGLSYACSNMAGICVAVIVDWMRKSLKDVHIDITASHVINSMVGGVYTPVRQFIILTWLVLFITFIIAYFFLEDWTVLDLEDLDEEYCNDDNRKRIPLDILPAKPMVCHDTMRQYFTYEVLSTDDETSMLNISAEGTKEMNKLPEYRIFKTQYAMSNEEGTETHPFKGVVHAVKQFIAIIQLRATWRVIVFSFVSVPVVLQWTASDMVLPPFLERRFGEQIPIYTIQSIHMLGCLVLPPFAQAFTSQMEDFRVIIPGLFLMGISPIFLAILPNVTGACLWQLCMTFGQVFWSPRQDSWTAGLAPVGMEGLFFAIGSSRALLAPLGDWIMGAMNSKYNPNCITCRDSVGHFCSNPMASSDTDNQNELVECWSVQESCDIYVDSSQECPSTCNDCPDWNATNPSTVWYILLLISITSPLLAWVFLPFLRNTRR